MAAAGYVGHASPRTGSAADRLRRAAIAASVVAENVGRVYGVDEAHTSFMDSPGHRANVLSPLATVGGVGVALGRAVGSQRELLVTELFMHPVEALAEDRAIAEVRGRIHDSRSLRSRPPLTSSALLDTVAHDLAERLAGGSLRPDELSTALESSLESAAGRSLGRGGSRRPFRHLTALVKRVTELAALGPMEEATAAELTHLGLAAARQKAVRRATDAPLAADPLFVVLLLASGPTAPP
jgi:hypothetical protein